jgi:hypothetical protein
MSIAKSAAEAILPVVSSNSTLVVILRVSVGKAAPSAINLVRNY